MLKKEATDKVFTPEKYGMTICLLCNGLGKFVNEANEIECL